MLVLTHLLSIVIATAYATVATGQLAVSDKHQLVVQKQSDSPDNDGRPASMIAGTATVFLHPDSRQEIIDMQRIDLELSVTDESAFGKVIMKRNVLQDLGLKPTLHYAIYSNRTRLLTRHLDICHSLSQAPVSPGWLDLKQEYTTLKEALHQGPFELMVWHSALRSLVLPDWYTVFFEIRDSEGYMVSRFKFSRWLDGRRS